MNTVQEAQPGFHGDLVLAGGAGFNTENAFAKEVSTLRAKTLWAAALAEA